MKVINKILCVTMFALTTIASNANAGLIFDVNNQVTGANDVMVNGISYDVVFTDTQSCNDVYTCATQDNDFPFQPNLDINALPINWDVGGAVAAADALLAMFASATNVNGLNYAVDPALTNGCSNYWLCEIVIPWQVRGGDGLFDAVRAVNHRNTDSISSNTLTAFDVDYLFSEHDYRVLAAFTLASSDSSSNPVPSPQSLGLFLLGLASIVIRRKRK